MNEKAPSRSERQTKTRRQCRSGRRFHGAAANGYNAYSMKVDVLTYSRTKGLFREASPSKVLDGSDDDAIKPSTAVRHRETDHRRRRTTPAAGKGLVDLLDKTRQPKSSSATETASARGAGDCLTGIRLRSRLPHEEFEVTRTRYNCQMPLFNELQNIVSEKPLGFNPLAWVFGRFADLHS